MPEYSKDRWAGTQWPSIEVVPAEGRFFPRVPLYLAATYGFRHPKTTDILDGWVAEFEVLGSPAAIHIDN
jgi:hypothetical protein